VRGIASFPTNCINYKDFIKGISVGERSKPADNSKPGDCRECLCKQSDRQMETRTMGGDASPCRPTKRITTRTRARTKQRNLIKSGPRKTGSFTFPLMDATRAPAFWITQHVSTLIIQFHAGRASSGGNTLLDSSKHHTSRI